MSTYALINKDGVVENTVLWDGVGKLFKEYTVINIDGVNCGIGWIYDSGEFTYPFKDEDQSGG